MESKVPSVRLAYLLSQYPAVNHVFMLREICRLRSSGFEIHAFSIAAPDRPLTAMTEAERAEVRSTVYVKDAGLVQCAGAHFRTLFTHPFAYFRGLHCALRRAAWSPRTVVYGLFYFTEALVVGRAMMRLRLSHLHTHFSSTVALLVARTFPVTMSATFHGPMEFDNPEVFRLHEKIGASLFSCAISRYGLSRLMYFSSRSQWPKLELTRLGVDPAEFAARPFRPDPSPLQLLFVGRLAPVKGLYILLDAMDALVRQGHDILLRLAGDGPDRAALERQVQTRRLSRCVSFLGNVHQDKLREIYRETDVLVLPSFAEGLPVVLMEAMAMEIPCVATWVAGVPELISDGIDGLLTPPADVDALVRALVRLKSDPACRLRFGQRARQRVLQEYDVAENTRRLADVFRRRLQEGTLSHTPADAGLAFIAPGNQGS